MYLTQSVQGGSMFSSIYILVGFAVVFYFFVLRPQKKQQKELKETLDNLKVGDHIVTRAGLRAEIVQLKGDSIVVQSGPDNVKLEFLRQAISYVEASSSLDNGNSLYSNEPIGDLSYGNDSRFIEKLNELKLMEKNKDKDFDLLLEDVYEYIVIEDAIDEENIQKTFRLDKERTIKILDELTELGIISEKNEDDERSINIDPRN